MLEQVRLLTNRAIPSVQSCLFNVNTFNSFLILFTSYLYFIFAFRYCLYVNTCFLLFIPLFQKLYRCRIVLSTNLNLKMTVERSKRRSYFLSLVFITKCFAKNLLLRKSKTILVILTLSRFMYIPLLRA